MPHLKSLTGLLMTAKYVRNWYLLLPLYAGVLPNVAAYFRDGKKVVISKDDYLLFYEELYKRYLQAKGFTYVFTEERTIVHTPNGLQIILRPNLANNSEAYSFVFDEIFVMNVYGSPNLHGRIVIDIGASLGDTALYFLSMGASKVYGFEPNFDYYELAQETIKLNHMEDRIYIYNELATSNKVKQLIQCHGLENVFLKIDCEGCEYEFIKNLDKRTSYTITDIVIEYHRKSRSLTKDLIKLGYQVYDKNKFFWKKQGILHATKKSP